jgi:predicted nucleotidyltransferase
MELSAVTAIASALNDAGVRYLVVGGLAVNAHGYVRMTMDVDLVIGLERQNIINGLQTLARIGYRPAVPISPEQFADPANRRKWQEEKNMRVLKLWNDMFRLTPLDVFVYEPFNFNAEYAAALRSDLGDGLTIPIVRLEALLAMKREAGRPQDIADIAALGGRQD